MSTTPSIVVNDLHFDDECPVCGEQMRFHLQGLKIVFSCQQRLASSRATHLLHEALRAADEP